jgi:hypothetical protein
MEALRAPTVAFPAKNILQTEMHDVNRLTALLTSNISICFRLVAGKSLWLFTCFSEFVLCQLRIEHIQLLQNSSR